MDFKVTEKYKGVWTCSCHNDYHSPDPNTPAFKSKSEVSYWYHGELHREDGPAYYYTDHLIVPPKVTKQYYIKNIVYSKKEFIQRYEMIYLKKYEGE